LRFSVLLLGCWSCTFSGPDCGVYRVEIDPDEDCMLHSDLCQWGEVCKPIENSSGGGLCVEGCYEDSDCPVGHRCRQSVFENLGECVESGDTDSTDTLDTTTGTGTGTATATGTDTAITSGTDTGATTETVTATGTATTSGNGTATGTGATNTGTTEGTASQRTCCRRRPRYFPSDGISSGVGVLTG
jgi:hypothetical protein